MGPPNFVPHQKLIFIAQIGRARASEHWKPCEILTLSIDI